jgi:hypothetical protein
MEQPPELTVALPSRWHRPGVVLPALGGLSVLGGFLPSFSVAANLYVMVLGGLLLAAGLLPMAGRRPAPARLSEGVHWWLLPIVLFAVVETVTFLLGSTYDYPTLSVLGDPLLESYPVRGVAYFGWLAVFWALVRR